MKGRMPAVFAEIKFVRLLWESLLILGQGRDMKKIGYPSCP